MNTLRKIVKPVASFTAQSAVFTYIIHLSSVMAKFAPHPVFRVIYSIGGFVVGWVITDKTGNIIEEYIDGAFDTFESLR